MSDASNSLKPWITLAGGVLVIVVLYWAQAVLVPIVLAILLSFVLAPPVNWLERWLGRRTAMGSSSRQEPRHGSTNGVG